MPSATDAAGRTRSAKRGFDPREYRDPSPWPALVHLLGVVNRAFLLPGLLKLRRFDLPAADLARLRAAVNPRTAAFLGPNHPEFFTDWMVDKEVSRLCSPLMAHWASWEIVNASAAARAFWLANNLIANAPGGGGKAYSVAWARRGHGVLLHPEGTATWQGERVSALLPGLVDMAWETAGAMRAAGDGRPVVLVPLVWRLRFTGDPTRGLARDMGRLERGLGLPRGDRQPAPERFAALVRHLLVRESRRLGSAEPDLGPDAGGYFAAQERVRAELVRALEARYGPLDPEFVRAQFQLRRAMREREGSDPEGVRRDRARLREWQRLVGLDPALYDRPRLETERVAEVLKRTRSSLLTRGLTNTLHNLVPVAAAARTVHVRVAEPIAVHEAWRDGAPETTAERRAALLAEHRARLQATLDRLGLESAPAGGARSWPNLLHSGHVGTPGR